MSAREYLMTAPLCTARTVSLKLAPFPATVLDPRELGRVTAARIARTLSPEQAARLRPGDVLDLAADVVAEATDAPAVRLATLEVLERRANTHLARYVDGALVATSDALHRFAGFKDTALPTNYPRTGSLRTVAVH